MKTRIGVSGTVGCHEKGSVLKIWSVDRGKFDLYRPLAKLRAGRENRGSGCHMLFHRFGVICSGFPLYKRDGAGRAGGETVAQTVTVVVAQQSGFSIYHADSSFVTGGRAESAAVTFLFVDLNDLSYHNIFLSNADLSLVALREILYDINRYNYVVLTTK